MDNQSLQIFKVWIPKLFFLTMQAKWRLFEVKKRSSQVCVCGGGGHGDRGEEGGGSGSATST